MKSLQTKLKEAITDAARELNGEPELISSEFDIIAARRCAIIAYEHSANVITEKEKEIAELQNRVSEMDCDLTISISDLKSMQSRENSLRNKLSPIFNYFEMLKVYDSVEDVDKETCLRY